MDLAHSKLCLSFARSRYAQKYNLLLVIYLNNNIYLYNIPATPWFPICLKIHMVRPLTIKGDNNFL